MLAFFFCEGVRFCTRTVNFHYSECYFLDQVLAIIELWSRLVIELWSRLIIDLWSRLIIDLCSRLIINLLRTLVIERGVD